MSRLLGRNQEGLQRSFYQRAKNKAVETLFLSKTRPGLDKFHKGISHSFKTTCQGAYGRLSDCGKWALS
ncbi:hypothetical protein GTQ34_05730 [Muricauda sp. JGD-17]|uniref:Uncharacterized protein n=1 Tax=Flagellimonas ochracea TaxID=2696472 RepID=A0A964TAR5_9FLAO|nr:hypothetical protein [Allomuricauda ochracea]NAY91414.1 hypothetical protein [Allomuricauda ochracea]